MSELPKINPARFVALLAEALSMEHEFETNITAARANEIVARVAEIHKELDGYAESQDTKVN